MINTRVQGYSYHFIGVTGIKCNVKFFNFIVQLDLTCWVDRNIYAIHGTGRSFTRF